MSETPSFQSSNIHRWGWVVLGISGILYALLGSPIYIPDSYEHLILAECMGEGNSTRIDCDSVAYAFRPPLPAFLLVLTSIFAHPMYGIVLLSWLAVAIMPAVLWRFAPPTVSVTHRASMTLLLMIAPLFHVFCQLGDARTIVLPMILTFGLCLWHVRENPSFSRRASIFAGLMVVLATLTRPESILLAPLGAIWIWRYARSRIKVYGVVTFLPLAFWWAYLSHVADRLVLAPRHWESTLLHAWGFMPLRWAKQLYGMGLWNTPARQASMTLEPASVVPDISFSDWFEWLFQGVTSGFSWWLLLLAMVVAVWSLRSSGGRSAFMVFATCAVPNVVAALLPQARDPLFQISNLFPLFLTLILLFGWSVGQLLSSLPKYRTPALALVAGLFWLGSTAPEIKNGIEFTAAGHEASQWLRNHTSRDRSVISSFESAPMVFLANRRWEQWPSRWDQHRLFSEDAPVLVVSSEDGFWTGNTFAGRTLPSPSAYFAIHNQWVVVFDMADR